MTPATTIDRKLRVGMVGMGMIFAETYRPILERLHRQPLYDPSYGPVPVELTAVATRTGERAQRYWNESQGRIGPFLSTAGPAAVEEMLSGQLDCVCIATPDERHFSPALSALKARKHVLIEKPSVLSLQELDQLVAVTEQNGVLAKVVYHKLSDPDHKRLRTLVQEGTLQHINNGYCSLLEPKSISQGQFAEWVKGRNPATYVAVHYFKLIDFSLFASSTASLKSVIVHGQRGLVGDVAGNTWDSIQTRIAYRHEDGRDAAFDVHTSWVMPENFPGYVEQEVQFRFDNGVWNASQRKRGVEVTVEGCATESFKTTPNHHYNAALLEPWGEKRQRGYGLEVIERFFHEVAFVEWGGPPEEREQRLRQMRALAYNDLRADRNVVTIVQAQEAIVKHYADTGSFSWAEVNGEHGGLALWETGKPQPRILYQPRV
jgi:D-galacturonate reductase